MGLQLNDITNLVDGMTLDDQTAVVSGGGFEYKRLSIGKHPVRLVEYIELGEQMVMNHTKKVEEKQDRVRLTFEFLGKNDIEERADGNGFYAPRKSIELKKSYHEKAGFRKLFDKMRNGDSSITNMVQMVGRGQWLMGVEWTTKGEDGKRVVITKATQEKYEERAKANPDNKDYRIWDNIKNSEGFMIGAAVREVYDEDSGEPIDTAPIKVREPIGALALFVWNDPNPMCWDSIYIDGSYTKKVDGNEVEVSKNRWQEAILGALNFAGSPIEAMLGGVDNLPGTVGEDDGDMGDSDVGKSSAPTDVDGPATQTSETSAKSAPTSPSDDVDEFDELDL